MDFSRDFFVALMICGALAAMALSEELPPEVLAVAHAENTNRDLLKRTPAFTCLETIDRTVVNRKHRRPRNVDVIQVEVGIGTVQEVYSWPGQHRFSASNLPELVGHGFVSTGIFNVFASNLFVERAGLIKFVGPDSIQGRNALRYSYKVQDLKSNWNINWLGASGFVGENGEFWVDSSDFTLLRLAANAVDIPPSIPLTSLKVLIDYKPIAIADEKALLPELAQINATEISGDIHQNRVFFSHCHVFSSSSVLLASAEDLGNAISQYELSRQTLPGGRKLQLKLAEPIDSLSAKVGDSITAELEHPVRLLNGDTIPAGALVKGYVRAFERIEIDRLIYAVGLEFDEIDWSNHAADFLGRSISFDRLNGLSQMVSRNEIWRDSATYLTSTETFTPPEIPGVETFIMTGPHVRLPKGFHMLWETREHPQVH